MSAVLFSDKFQQKTEIVEKNYAISTSTLSRANKITSLIAFGVALQHAPFCTLLGALVGSSCCSIEKSVSPPFAEKFKELTDAEMDKEVKESLDFKRNIHVTNAMFSAIFATYIAMVPWSHVFTPYLLGIRGAYSAHSLLSETLNRQSPVR